MMSIIHGGRSVIPRKSMNSSENEFEHPEIVRQRRDSEPPDEFGEDNVSSCTETAERKPIERDSVRLLTSEDIMISDLPWPYSGA